MDRRTFVSVTGTLSAASLLTPRACAAAPVAEWQFVPLRTAEQKAKGYAGGEMAQVAFCLAISPSDPNYLAIGIDTAAVYTSIDGAKSWQIKRRGIKCNGVQSVAFDPKNKSILWAAGLRGAGADKTYTADTISEQELLKYTYSKADGIYRSTDGGENWLLLRNAFILRRFEQNEYFAFDLDSFEGVECRTVYIATHREGLLKTIDAGRTWEVMGFPNTIITTVIFHPLNRRLFVATYAGLFQSDNEGRSFDKVGGGLPDMPVYALALNATDPNALYVALGKGGVWWSKDGGSTFQRSQGLSDKHDWRVLAVSPANPNNLYAKAHRTGDATTLCWSHDGGANWHPYEKWEADFYGRAHPSYFATLIVPHPTEADTAFNTIFPVEKTTDGGRAWQHCSEGILGSRRGKRTSIAFRPDDPKKMVFFFTDMGSVLTTDGGATFTLNSPNKGSLGMRTMPVGDYEPRPGSRKLISAIGGWQSQELCLSEDDGQTWVVQSNTKGDYQFLAFHPQKPDVVYAGGMTNSLRSRDGGKTWQTLQYSIRAMFRGNGDIVFARDASQVLKSIDQGETWERLPGKIGPFEIDVDPRNPDRVYTTVYNSGIAVFDGRAWTVRDERHGLERDFFGNLSFHQIAVDPTHPNIIYAGQNKFGQAFANGIFRSTNYGEHWENITGNLGTELNVWAITVSPHDGTVWLGTDYGNCSLPAFTPRIGRHA